MGVRFWRTIRGALLREKLVVLSVVFLQGQAAVGSSETEAVGEDGS